MRRSRCVAARRRLFTNRWLCRRNENLQTCAEMETTYQLHPAVPVVPAACSVMKQCRDENRVLNTWPKVQTVFIASRVVWLIGSPRIVTHCAAILHGPPTFVPVISPTNPLPRSIVSPHGYKKTILSRRSNHCEVPSDVPTVLSCA